MNIYSPPYPVLWESKSPKLYESPFPTEVDSYENSSLLNIIREYLDKRQGHYDLVVVWREMQRKWERHVLSLPSVESNELPAELEQLFRGLVKNWEEETGGMSSTNRRYAHPSYQAILGLGTAVVPLILRELQQRPDWWFEALTALAKPKSNPVKPKSTFEEAVAAWLDWGRENNLVD